MKSLFLDVTILSWEYPKKMRSQSYDLKAPALLLYHNLNLEFFLWNDDLKIAM